MYAEKTDYDDIEMTSRLRNILRRNGFESLEGLREYPKEHFINFHNMGPRTLQELYTICEGQGIKLRSIEELNDREHGVRFDNFLCMDAFRMGIKNKGDPKVMFIENALKSYVIEALLADSKSENFDVIYNKSLTAYRNYTPGSRAYKTEYTKRMNLKGKINAALVRDYNKRSVVAHFFNNDITIPVWAIFETLALGEFGTLYDCACTNVKLYVSNIMKLPTNLDSDGMNTKFFIFTVKDLQNAIAHNNVIFDTRFKTGKIDQRLVTLLETEVGISNIDFKYMDAYIIMITYFLRKMGETKTACKQFVASYQQQTEYLRNELPINIYNQVVGTKHRPNMNALQKFISKS